MKLEENKEYRKKVLSVVLGNYEQIISEIKMTYDEFLKENSQYKELAGNDKALEKGKNFYLLNEALKLEENKEYRKKTLSVVLGNYEQIISKIGMTYDDFLEKNKHFKNIEDDSENWGLLSEILKLEENKDKNIEYVLNNKDNNFKQITNVSIETIEKNKKYLKSLKRAYKKNEKSSTLVCKVVNEYKNLVYRLIDGFAPYAGNDDTEKSYPLYWDIKEDKGISIALLGAGRIGIEFIKTVCWLGQMLSTIKDKDISKKSSNYAKELKIYVWANNAKDVIQRLKFEMSGLNFEFTGTLKLKTCFFTINFENIEYGTKNFEDKFNDKFPTGPNFNLDYILVALGDDNTNIEAAKWLKREIDRRGEKRNIPINFIVEDSNFCDLLKEREETEKCILNPFGSLKSRYKIDNLVMPDLERYAWSVNQAHDRHEKKIKFLNDHYNRESSIASALHYAYRYVSFNYDEFKSNKSQGKGRLDRETFYGIDQKYTTHIYWLEHRRWQVYQYTLGYKCPTRKELASFIKFEKKPVEIKEKTLKLHGCLVEGDNGIQNLCEIKEKTGNWQIQREKWIKALMESSDETLENWLEKHIELDNCDSLDKLSILCDNEFKSFDIKVAESIARDESRRILIDLLDKYLNSKQQVSANEIKKIKGLLGNIKPNDVIGICSGAIIKYKTNVVDGNQNSLGIDRKWNKKYQFIKIDEKQFLEVIRK